MDKHTGITYYFESSKSTSYDYHFHLYYEVMYVTSGDVILYSDGHEVTLHSGTVCVIPSCTPHKTKYIDASVKYIVFGSFYIENYISDEALKQLGENFNTSVLISKRNTLTETVESLIEEIDMYDGESAYIFLYKMMMFCDAIYKLSKIKDNTITRAIHYIGPRSKSKITLDEIANACGVTKFHICR